MPQPHRDVPVFLSLIYVVGGLALLVFASDRLVASAVNVSRSIGISAVLIGAIVVGLGTSLPELLVSGLSARAGDLDIAMANVVGSNAANVTLVLGSAALAGPIIPKLSVVKREGLLMFGAVIALAAILLDGQVSTAEGIALLIGMVVAIVLLVAWSRNHSTTEVEAELSEYDHSGSVGRNIVLGLISLVATVISAQFLLIGAEDLGMRLGLSATFLGVLLGIGTSLPELATTLAAVRHGSPDIVVGNVVGSNLFNSLAVAGSAAVIGPGILVDMGSAEIGFMVVVVGIAGAFAGFGKLNRAAGSILIAGFIVLMILIQ